MAKELGVDVQTVYMWFTRKRISATGAILAERITNGFVTKQELRPDVNEWLKTNHQRYNSHHLQYFCMGLGA
jgi:DNA-binding transcriptional regulator YdaS (Cro superfamily)